MFRFNREAAFNAAYDLASAFECTSTSCFDYVFPPIIQCQNGHLVCASCRHKFTCCPSCRGPIGNLRNLAMEKVASTVFFACKYSPNGCKQLLMHREKADHEELCEYRRPYSCPCPGARCTLFSSLDEVMPHLLHSHKSSHSTLQGPIKNMASISDKQTANVPNLKRIQSQLILLLRAQKCLRRENISTAERRQCRLTDCRKFKNLIKHMRICISNNICTFPLCSSSRKILLHWEKCRKSDCPVCGDLVRAAQRVTTESR